MLRHYKWILPVAVVLASLRAAGEQPTDSLIHLVEARYDSAKTLSVNFEEKYSILGRERPTEAGTLVLRKQGKMRWDYQRPAGKLLVSDGKNIFLYTAADHRVMKVPMKQSEDMRAPLAFLLGRLDLHREFRDFQSSREAGGQRLVAQAKTDQLPYIDVAMLIENDGSIAELTVHGRDQSTMTFAFTNEQLNPRLPDSLFHFDIPPGAEVVDAISSQGQAQ